MSVHLQAVYVCNKCERDERFYGTEQGRKNVARIAGWEEVGNGEVLCKKCAKIKKVNPAEVARTLALLAKSIDPAAAEDAFNSERKTEG